MTTEAGATGRGGNRKQKGMESRNRNSDLPPKTNYETFAPCTLIAYNFFFRQVPRLLSLRGINAAGARVLAFVPVAAYVIATPLVVVVGTAVGHADGDSL